LSDVVRCVAVSRETVGNRMDRLEAAQIEAFKALVSVDSDPSHRYSRGYLHTYSTLARSIRGYSPTEIHSSGSLEDTCVEQLNRGFFIGSREGPDDIFCVVDS
jgi:DNA-binding Lrp family transcriptional regulator